jgi:hypothetical protein
MSETRPLASAHTFWRHHLLERLICRWGVYTTRRVTLRSRLDSAAAKRENEALRKGFIGWRLWSERRKRARWALDGGRARYATMLLRFCVRGWGAEARRQKRLLGRLLLSGAKDGIPVLRETSRDGVEGVSDGVRTGKGPSVVSSWAVALLQRIDASVGIRNLQTLEQWSLPEGKSSSWSIVNRVNRSDYLLSQKSSIGMTQAADMLLFAAGLEGSDQTTREKALRNPGMSEGSKRVFTMEDVCSFYRARSLARRALRAWRSECEHAQSKLRIANTFRSRSQAKAVLRSWLSFLRRRRQVAKAHRTNFVTGRVILLWRKHARRSAALRERLAVALRSRTHRTLSLALWNWQEWGVNRRTRREKIADAVVGILRWRMAAAFDAWKREAARRRRKRRADRQGLLANLGRVWRHWAGGAKARVLLRRVFSEGEPKSDDYTLRDKIIIDYLNVGIQNKEKDRLKVTILEIRKAVQLISLSDL